jgi:hypothetical protein
MGSRRDGLTRQWHGVLIRGGMKHVPMNDFLSGSVVGPEGVSEYVYGI